MNIAYTRPPFTCALAYLTWVIFLWNLLAPCLNLNFQNDEVQQSLGVFLELHHGEKTETRKIKESFPNLPASHCTTDQSVNGLGGQFYLL